MGWDTYALRQQIVRLEQRIERLEAQLTEKKGPPPDPWLRCLGCGFRTLDVREYNEHMERFK